MKYKTEVGDQTQYLAHEINDNTIRFILKYPCAINGELLSRAVRLLVSRVDLLHSSFKAGILGTKWVINQTYETDTLTSISEISGDVLETAKQAALHSITYSGTTQIRCYLFRNGSESALAFLVGHMCADGRDAAYLLNKLIELYNALSAGETGENVILKSGSRSVQQCYSDDPQMLSFDVDKIMSKKSNEIKSAYRFCTEDPGIPRMAECTISKESIVKCQKLVKDSTVNDVVLTAYYRAYIRQMHLSDNTPVGIASMMDLRKYIPEKNSAGIANLSGPISTNLPSGIGIDFAHTLSEVTQQTLALKKDKKAGLDSVLAIQKIYRTVPFPLIIYFGEKIYSNMSIGMTNLGNIKSENIKIENFSADKLIFAGPLKKKPALQLSVSGLDGTICLSIVSQCTQQEQMQLEDLLRIIVSEIETI